ncbi:MAG: response regulator [Bacteroidetes bacterium]|nr:response regulator [Bacteroidota bacterium]
MALLSNLHWFRVPEFSSADDQRRARIIFYFSVVIILASVIPGIHNYIRKSYATAIVLFSFPLFISFAVFFLYLKRLALAAHALSYGLLVFAFLLVVTGEGIYDISVLTYPACLIVGGLILSNRAFFVYLLVALFSVWGFWMLEINGYLLTKFANKVTITSLIDVWIILIVVGLAIRFYIRDIDRAFSRLREQEEQLRESESRFRMLFERSPDVIMLVDSDHRILLMNRGDTNSITGSLLTDWVHPDHREALIRQLSSGRAVSLEAQSIRNQWYRLRLQPMGSPSESILIIATDISETRRLLAEREQLETQFRQAQKLESLGQLAGGISHDFNNLLSVIITHADGLDRFRDQPEKLKTKTEAILKAADRGAALVRQILTFARKSDLKLTDTNLNSLVLEIVHLLEETFPKTIAIRIAEDPTLPILKTDSNQIHQVLMNLCVNARDAMSGSGTLSIETRHVQATPPGGTLTSCALLTISDTGSGMPAEVRQRIFEPFFTTKARDKGTGLGLAVVYGIVKAHQGWIEVDSAEGHGTTFRIFLPAPTGQQGSEGVREAGRQTSDDWKGKRILLAEADSDLRIVQEGALSEKGARVVTTGNGQDALTLYSTSREPIDLVMTNYNLPGLSGLELIRQIRLLNPDQTILLSTGTTDNEVYVQVADNHIPVLLKPFSPLKLITTIDGLFQAPSSDSPAS